MVKLKCHTNCTWNKKTRCTVKGEIILSICDDENPQHLHCSEYCDDDMFWNSDRIDSIEINKLIVVPKIVCLCGSGRFLKTMEQIEHKETLKGKIVLTIGCNTKDVARHQSLAKHKQMLDELHLRKIDLADEVFILNVGGYIGESTAKELEYAKSKGKKIIFLEATK